MTLISTPTQNQKNCDWEITSLKIKELFSLANDSSEIYQEIIKFDTLKLFIYLLLAK